MGWGHSGGNESGKGKPLLPNTKWSEVRFYLFFFFASLGCLEWVCHLQDVVGHWNMDVFFTDFAYSKILSLL